MTIMTMPRRTSTDVTRSERGRAMEGVILAYKIACTHAVRQPHGSSVGRDVHHGRGVQVGADDLGDERRRRCTLEGHVLEHHGHHDLGVIGWCKADEPREVQLLSICGKLAAL